MKVNRDVLFVVAAAAAVGCGAGSDEAGGGGGGPGGPPGLPVEVAIAVADTVVDATASAIDRGRATGFVFRAANAAALSRAIGRACDLYADRKRWAGVQRTGMTRDFGWPAAAWKYRALYRQLLR